MITEILSENNTSFITTLCQKSKGLGTGMEVSWAQKMQNPLVPWQFYKVGDDGFLYVNGSTATLCGLPDNSAEFSSFLAFLKLEQFVSNQYIPTNWRTLSLNILEHSAKKEFPIVKTTMKIQINKAPPMKQVISLLSKENPLSKHQQEFLYFNGCMRRNYGQAAIWGIYQNQKLVSTASLFAITNTHATLSCVETDSQWQKNGFAHALIANLCSYFAPRTIDLLCTDLLVPFYATLNFKKSGIVFLSTPPQ